MDLTINDVIKKYPKIFQDYKGNPGGVNWKDIPDGWVPVIDTLCKSIQHYIDNTSKWNNEEKKFINPPQVVCSQMKEKYGGLRFYTDGHDDIVEGMIHMAEVMCDNICQDCGTDKDLGTTSQYIMTICRGCVQYHGDRAMANWTEKTI